MEPVAPIAVVCPYCGESFETTADWSAGDQDYIEDCAVCCRPIMFHLDAQQRFVRTAREDE
ncbi:MAG: CPXCG motif-containing cysteine-rich protein [Acidiferrobacteraceae bacterium]